MPADLDDAQLEQLLFRRPPQIPSADRCTGEIRSTELFVSVLGASSCTYCEATWSQGLPDWIASHIRSFEFFGGVPNVLVPDNLKAGVSSPHLYEPDLNPTYQDLAVHYGVAVVPARVRRKWGNLIIAGQFALSGDNS